MYKVVTFFFTLFFSIVVSAQQSTVNKSTLSLTNTDVQISAAAIPMQEEGNVVIDSSTYHKAVQIGSQESSMQEVEMSAPAVQVNEHAPGIVPNVSSIEEEDSVKETIYKSERAQKVIPKRYF